MPFSFLCMHLPAAALLLIATPAEAQSASAASPESGQGPAAAGAVAQPPTPAADTAALVVQNRTVFVFRAPLGARTVHERAEAAAQRIRTLAEADVADTVSASAIPEGLLLSVGGRPLLAITPADLDARVGETLEQARTRVSRSLTFAIQAEREQRSLIHVLWAVGTALLATIAFIVLLRVLQRLRRVAVARMPEVAGPRLPSLSISGFTLLSADQILGFIRRGLELVAWGLGLFGAYLWLTYVLTRFPYSAPWGEALGSYLVETVKQLTLGALGAIPGLFTVVLIFFATRFLARLVTTVFRAIETGEVSVTWVHADTVQPTRRLVTALLWLFALVVAYPYLPGSGSDVFKGVSVFVGLVLSLGSSGVVNQAMSGLVLMYARALKPGDYVRVDETEGTVVELGLLSTKVRTNKHELVTIPNAVLVGTTTKNYSRLAGDGDGVILYTSVTIGYDTPWRQVHALLIDAAMRTPGLRDEPRPFVRQTGLSDFYAEYQLNAVIERPEERVAVLSVLHGNIQDCFNEVGVQIMSPHYENDPGTPKIVPRDAWDPAPYAGSIVSSRDGAGVRRPDVDGRVETTGDGLASGAPRIT